MQTSFKFSTIETVYWILERYHKMFFIQETLVQEFHRYNWRVGRAAFRCLWRGWKAFSQRVWNHGTPSSDVDSGIQGVLHGGSLQEYGEESRSYQVRMAALTRQNRVFFPPFICLINVFVNGHEAVFLAPAFYPLKFILGNLIFIIAVTIKNTTRIQRFVLWLTFLTIKCRGSIQKECTRFSNCKRQWHFHQWWIRTFLYSWNPFCQCTFYFFFMKLGIVKMWWFDFFYWMD